VKIGSLDTARRVVVVAEIGNNHEGDIAVAREMLEAAAASGADAVKFQTFATEHFVSRLQPERFARLEGFRLTPEDFAGLAELARARGVAFISTPLDLGSVDVLAPLVDALKVASGDNTFGPLLRAVARTGLPVILSAGLAVPAEIEAAVATVRATWAECGVDGAGRLAVLHCVSSYPVAPAEANLRAIEALRALLDCEIGYSDHTTGLDAALLAVALGARLVEKHFTLDKAFSDFRDHQLSATPAELEQLVARIREAESMLGRPAKDIQPSEQEGRILYRRSAAAAADLRKGHVLAPADVTWLRPGGGLAPDEEQRLLGRALARDIAAGEQLRDSDVV
jgi:sialic acid synthase SpsE